MKCIPSLNKQISEMLSQKELELTKLEIDGISKGGVGFNEDKGPAILNIINRFTN